MTMRSVTPRTPMCRTWSAILKASAKVVFSLAILNRFWLGMTISVSTTFSSSVMPCSADCMRRRPSKWKGLVTTPMVRMPCSRAARGDDRCGTGAGAAAHAGGDEHHVAPSSSWQDLVQRLLGGLAADLGTRTGAQALGDGDAELDAAVGERLAERLRVGVARR